MKNTMKIGSLVILGLVAASASARTAVRTAPEVRPLEVRPNVAPTGRAAPSVFEGMKTAAPAATTQKPAESCDRNADLAMLAQNTGLNQGIVETGMKQLVVQGCKAGERGFLEFSPEAQKIAVLTGYYMEQNKLTGPAALAKAQSEVKKINVTPEQAAPAYQALLQGNAEACNVFKRTN